ncbi:MAG TPA: TonB-dependent receptor, partial [Chitinophagaceae bacterium]|nr:TonB-dependent receptor [Chitinophagaceae bacterium]
MRHYFLLVISIYFFNTASAQGNDTVYSKKDLPAVNIKGYKAMNGIGRIDNYSGEIIFSGKKNELLIIDSLNANKALNNTRQIIGRIPGVNIIETESGGFTANGISFRGLNPYQTISMNTRQNGYNISADIVGYNEAYYLPATEAVSGIQFLRGASGLQFGAQPGGLVNYILKEASIKPVEIKIAQTVGSYGLYNLYTQASGTINKWQYFGFVQYRTLNGWRENSDQKQISGFGKIKYNASSKLSLSLEYTLLRNKIHMPGGLTDSMFYEKPLQSVRARNWLQSPWNIIASNIEYKISNQTSVNLKSWYQFSQRNLIWQNEDSWYPNYVPDIIGNPRELEREFFNNITNELRILSNYTIGEKQQTISFGVRQSFALMRKMEGGPGDSGTALDLTQKGPYATDMNFKTNNLAFFAENIFHVNKKLSITPGFRFEYLQTNAYGYAENKDISTSSNTPTLYIDNQKSTRTFFLSGLSLQYQLSSKINMYGNFSQSYRPVTYSDLTPFGTSAIINQNLKDSKTNNADLGIRGQLKNVLNFDISVFYLSVNNQIATVPKTNANGSPYFFVTNVGSDRHIGIETYGELNIL